MIPTRVGQQLESAYFAGFLIVSGIVKCLFVTTKDFASSTLTVPCIRSSHPGLCRVDSEKTNQSEVIRDYAKLLQLNDQIPSELELSLCWLHLSTIAKTVLTPERRFIPSYDRTEFLPATVVTAFTQTCTQFQRNWYLSSSTTEPVSGWRSLIVMSFCTGCAEDVFLVPINKFLIRPTFTLSVL